jgi:AcrR family transcriptional regulator
VSSVTTTGSAWASRGGSAGDGTADSDDAGNAHRNRLLTGMAAALAEKGYAAVTIADVARHARVSKRTFYEHFGDKRQCFLAVYTTVSDRLLAHVGAAAADELPWPERIRAAVRAYLGAMAAEPMLTRTMLLEIQSVGPDGLRLRRDVHRRFAALLSSRAEEGLPSDIKARPLTTELATAVIGGVNELVLDAVEEGTTGRVLELDNTASDLIRAVLLLPPAPA